MKPIRLCLTLATALVAVACQDRRAPTSPPAFLIEDHYHGGNQHFYLLPPVVPPRTITEQFNRGLTPLVRITERPSLTDPQNATCSDGEAIAVFTTASGPDFRVVMDASNRQYGIVWKTRNFSTVSAPCVYRLQVEVSGLVLGFADVELVESGKAFKNAAFLADDAVPLLEDGSLPFKFFIGYGAVIAAVTNGTVEACRPDRDCGEGLVSPAQSATILTDQQQAGVFIPAGAVSVPTIVAIEQRTDRPCIPTANLALRQFEDCYRYVAFPVDGGSIAPTEGELNPPTYRFNTDVTVGMCVEIGGLSPAQAALLQIFRFETDQPTAPAVALPNASAAFLPCDPAYQPGGSGGGGGGLGGVLRRGWQLALHGVRALLGARPAYASAAVINFGLGGGSGSLSYFTWGFPAVLLPNVEDTTFDVVPGDTVGPSVVLQDLGNAPMAGVLVTFARGEGTTRILGDSVVTTGGDGVVRVNWQLPATAGTYTLTASAPGAAESPRHFLATVRPTQQIAFETNRDGSFEIYLVNTDGTGLTRLTNNSVIDVEPAWSPDGLKIAFQSRRDDIGDIFVMNADGSQQTNLTFNPILGLFELWPDWSPDGTNIAYMIRGSFDQIFVMNADGSNNTFVAGTATAGAGFPSWSADGTKIAFATNRDGNAEIYVMNADGSNQVNLTQNPGFDLTPKWSRDGTKIAFFTTRDGNGEVYVMNADGSNPVNLTNNPANDRVGGWSADSRFIVFDSDRDGNSEIYIMRADGTNVTRVTNNAAEDESPALRP